MRDPEPSVIGIDIGSSAIKIVQIRKKHSQAHLETYGELALGPYGSVGIGQAVALAPEKISEALVNLMNEKEVGVSTKKCGVSIAFASSLMTVIEMPKVSPKQLASMIPLEARKYIPVPISEVMLDWSIIPRSEVKVNEDDVQTEETPVRSAQTKTEKLDILVVAIHNETLTKYQNIITNSGLEAGFFEIEIFSTMRAVLDNTVTPIMVLDIGAASTKVYVVERGMVRISHTVNRGGQDVTQTISKSLGLPMEQAEIMKRETGILGDNKGFAEAAALALNYIFSEAYRVLFTFEKKYNRAVSKVVLVGGGAALKGIADIARENFKTEVVQGNPFGKLATPAFLEKVLEETGPEFSVAIGLALRRLAEED
jgi:type IV pilus assembly protein PilM